MKAYASRRIVNATASGLIAVLLITWHLLSRRTLGSTSFTSGWILFGVIAFLAAYNLRKALPFLPLGKSSTWLQLHIYGGLLSAVIFAIHVRLAVPNGIFESMLAAIYLFVFVSGLFGLFITRLFPKWLTHLGDEVIFEQIPIARRQLCERARAIALNEQNGSGAIVIAEVYRDHVEPFLRQNASWNSNLTGKTAQTLNRLKRELEDQSRYLQGEDRERLQELQRVIDRKAQLDRQYALQWMLKVWLLFHIPASYALLIFAVFHVILVYGWYGGL